MENEENREQAAENMRSEATLLLACIVDDVWFLPGRPRYPVLVGSRFELVAPVNGTEFTFRVATMVAAERPGPAKLEIAVLTAGRALLVNAGSELALEPGIQLNLTPVKAQFDAPGAYLLGVALDGRPTFLPLDVLPVEEATR